MVRGIRPALRIAGRVVSWIGYGFLLVVALWTFMVLLQLALAPVTGMLVALLWWCSSCSGAVLDLADIVLRITLVLVPLALLALYISRRWKR